MSETAAKVQRKLWERTIAQDHFKRLQESLAAWKQNIKNSVKDVTLGALSVVKESITGDLESKAKVFCWFTGKCDFTFWKEWPLIFTGNAQTIELN